MVIKQTEKRAGVGPSFKGQFYQYMKGDQHIVASWPQHTKTFKSVRQERAKALFKEACKAIKLTAATFQNESRESAKGTPMLPRDALMAALYGKGPTIVFPNGERLVPMASRVEMSKLLDNLGWTNGSILYRDPSEYWKSLEPGTEDQVLVIDENGLPSWQTLITPTGASAWTTIDSGAMSGSGYAGKGSWFKNWFAHDVQEFAFEHQFPASQVIKAAIYEVNSGGVIQSILVDETVTTTQDGTVRQAYHKFSSTISLSAGKIYCMMVRRSDGSDTNGTPIAQGTTMNPSFPVTGNWGYCNITKANPVVGNTCNLTSGNPYCVMFR